jgi:hypothetical protein
MHPTIITGQTRKFISLNTRTTLRSYAALLTGEFIIFFYKIYYHSTVKESINSSA